MPNAPVAIVRYQARASFVPHCDWKYGRRLQANLAASREDLHLFEVLGTAVHICEQLSFRIRRKMTLTRMMVMHVAGVDCSITTGLDMVE